MFRSARPLQTQAGKSAGASAIVPTLWTAEERAAWDVPPKLTPDQWAERYAVIPDNGVNPEPGPVSLDRTPYLRGMLQAAVDPVVSELVFLKCTQVGFSTWARLLLSYQIDAAPGPAMILLPDEEGAKDWLKEDVVPTLEQTPRLQRYRLRQKNANKETTIRLSSMWIFAVWATSPAKLARRPIRYLYCDETDKFPAFSGKESDPISLATKRLSNWKRRAKKFLGSTPTTRLGPIYLAFEACADKRHYEVPCPVCGRYQRLLWPQVKWEPAAAGESRASHANRVLVDRLAWYECRHCQSRIHDLHKPRLLRLGLWVSEGQAVELRPEGPAVVGDRPRSARVGFHLSSLYSPWLDFAELASEWIHAQAALEIGDVAKLMDFMNSRLAEPFEQQVQGVKQSAIRDKAKAETAPPPLIVPKWTKALIASADTQGNNEQDGWFPFVVRAWAPGFRSQLVRYSIAHSFDELLELTIDGKYQCEDGRVVMPWPLLIDMGGHRTTDVWNFGRANRGRVVVTKGSDHPLPAMVSRRHNKAHQLLWWLLDPNQTKDLLARLIGSPDPDRWQVHRDLDDQYVQQMGSEHKIFDRKLKREVWVLRSRGVPNHAWDCEAMQCAAAFEAGLGVEEPDEPPPPPKAPTREPRPPLGSYKKKW